MFRPYRTHTTQVPNYAAKHRPSTRQNICEPLRVISVKHSSVLPDDGSYKIRNMSEWFLIFYLLNFYITYILTSKFCISECISRVIKVIDYNNARWSLFWIYKFIVPCRVVPLMLIWPVLSIFISGINEKPGDGHYEVISLFQNVTATIRVSCPLFILVKAQLYLTKRGL